MHIIVNLIWQNDNRSLWPVISHVPFDLVAWFYVLCIDKDTGKIALFLYLSIMGQLCMYLILIPILDGGIDSCAISLATKVVYQPDPEWL